MLRVLVGEEADFEDLRQAAADGGTVSWIVLKAAEPGDEVVFFFPFGKRFVAHGRVSSEPERHFFGRKPAYRADVDGIELLNPTVPLDAVAKRFPERNWVNSYTKGPTNPPREVAEGLLSFLRAQAPQPDHSLPEEIPAGVTYAEGSVQQTQVVRFERDPKARRDCLAQYGATCAICGFDFGCSYGEQMAGLIHVHHLKPLSTIGEDYRCNPVRDLRPVCPNCHAVLHRRNPPYSLSEVRQLLQDAQARRGSQR